MSDTTGPAFPSLQTHQQYDEDAGKYRDVLLPTGGMTLRDYFAAKAMQGVLSNHRLCQHLFDRGDTALAAYAYKVAEALLTERERGKA